MAKRSKRKKQQQTRRNQALTGIGIVVALLVAGGLAFAFSGAGGPPEVAESRLELDPVLGDPDAPVTVIEYGAYGCHACRAWHQAGVIEQILAEFGGQVNFTFRDFPVIAPNYDRAAANIAQCALDQSEDLFWSYHNALYTVADTHFNEEQLLNLGGQAGLNEAELRECAGSDTHRRTVQYDEARAFQLGLRGTPGFIVDGQVIYNASPDVLRNAIRAALNG